MTEFPVHEASRRGHGIEQCLDESAEVFGGGVRVHRLGEGGVVTLAPRAAHAAFQTATLAPDELAELPAETAALFVRLKRDAGR